jgi:hypothetical protein
MTELSKFLFTLNNVDYILSIISQVGSDGYNLNFIVALSEKGSNRVIFQTICGDWLSTKDVVNSYFIKIGTMLSIDPDTVERIRNGYFKN